MVINGDTQGWASPRLINGSAEKTTSPGPAYYPNPQKGETQNGVASLFGESFGIFVVSIVVLYVLSMITGKKATGIGWVHWKGYVLIGVGALYFVFGGDLDASISIKIVCTTGFPNIKMDRG